MTISELPRASAETWTDVPGVPGYEVSDLGRVRSYRSRHGLREEPCILKGYRNLDGYIVVNLVGAGPRTVHSLVAQAFLGQRPHGSEVRHLDGNPGNPALANLAYGTSAENQADRILHGTSNRGTRQHKSRLTEADVLEIRRVAGQEPGLTKREIGLRFGVSRTTVSSIIRGDNWAWLEDKKVSNG